MSFTI